MRGARPSMRARRPEQQTRVVHYIVTAAVCSGQQRIFPVFFLALSTTLPPPILHLPPLHQTFRPLSSSFRRIFILRRFPLLSPYFWKTPPAVSCCRRAIKDNRNISGFFVFRAVVRRFRVGATQPCVSSDNITQFRNTCGATIAQCVCAPMNNILFYFVSYI